jgi:hypothetical protein
MAHSSGVSVSLAMLIGLVLEEKAKEKFVSWISMCE